MVPMLSTINAYWLYSGSIQVGQHGTEILHAQGVAARSPTTSPLLERMGDAMRMTKLSVRSERKGLLICCWRDSRVLTNVS